MNIRSIPKNLDSLKILLESLNCNFSVIGFSETWLTPSNYDCYGISNYQHFHITRKNRHGGGLSIFVHNNLNVKQRDDLTGIHDVAEVLFIELKKEEIGSTKDTIVGLTYRPPNTDVSAFNEFLLGLLVKVKKENKKLYLMGDFNINLLQSESHIPTAEFIENLYSHSLFPMITKPTRVIKNTTTLIDNIFGDITSCNDMLNGIVFTDISDHFPVFSFVKNAQLSQKHVTRKTRCLTNENIEKFKDKLRMVNWDPIMMQTDGNMSFMLFYDRFCKLYQQSFPFRSLTMNYKSKHKWLTAGLRKSIAEKNRLYIKSRKEPAEETINFYKSYKTKLNRALRNAERQYYSNLLETNRNNLKKFWAVIKEVINKKKQNSYPTQFKIGNCKESNRHTIADKFNKYFTNIGNDLAKLIPRGVKDPLSYIPQSNSQTMYVAPVQSCEVIKIIQTLKNSSAGHDNIHSSILKKTYNLYLEPLTHVLNLSLTQGFFPNSMKIAHVVPLYKSGDPAIISNYRPVSILPLFSKILERLMYNRLLNFIDSHNILYKYQFGFREGYSTNMALVILVDKILEAIDSGEIVIGVFLDFSKAFDTVNHTILLDKLYKYGIRGVAYNWFIDYLKERKQYVCFDNVNSNHQSVNCGVPQGSILGPLLFLLYINDIVQVSDVLLPIIYADDTNVFLKGNSVNETITKMNHELSNVVDWLNCKKLSLNVAKTQYIIFRSSRRKIINHDKILINNTEISCVSHTKFIGVEIDEKLSWQFHINMIRNKISKGIGILCKARKSLPNYSLITLYYSMILHILYRGLGPCF